MKIGIVSVALLLAELARAGEPRVVNMYQTVEGGEFQRVEASMPFSRHRAVSVPVLDLDSAKDSHPFEGLGVSFSEASCKILCELPADERAKVLKMVFSNEGAGLSMGRVQVGCSDYSVHVYTYDDVPDDLELKHFSIDDDRKYILPVIKESSAVNPDLYLFGSVWTPPAWMKLGRELCGGWIDRNRLPVFCDYYVKFLQAYAKEGIVVRAISAQNEPCSDQEGESPECKWGPNEEMEFIGQLMPPRLKAAGLKTKMWMHDCEPYEWRQVLSELDDPDVLRNTDGIAWHSYAGDPTEGLAQIRRRHPNMRMYHTEMGPHLDGSRTITWWGKRFTPFVNGGCSSLTSWCLALDEQGLPNTSRGFNCAGLVEIHSKTHVVKPSAQWDFFRHIGPYVRRGAQVLMTGYDSQSVTGGAVPMSERHVMAFRNPDGAYVIVATNENGGKVRKMQLQIKCGEEYAWLQLPSRSVTTIIVKK